VSLRRQILEAARRIPRGRAATYGDVAAAAGSPRSAREVGRALAGLPADTDVPWWRIVNSQGAISPRAGGGAVLQAALLAEEGLLGADGRVDLRRFRWDPATETSSAAPKAWD